MKNTFKALAAGIAAVMASTAIMASASAYTYIDKDGYVTHDNDYTDFMVYVQDSSGKYEVSDIMYVGKCEFCGETFCKIGGEFYAYNGPETYVSLGTDFAPTKSYGTGFHGRPLYFTHKIGCFYFEGGDRAVYGFPLNRKDKEGRELYWKRGVGYYGIAFSVDGDSYAYYGESLDGAV